MFFGRDGTNLSLWVECIANLHVADEVHDRVDDLRVTAARCEDACAEIAGLAVVQQASGGNALGERFKIGVLKNDCG